MKPQAKQLSTQRKSIGDAWELVFLSTRDKSTVNEQKAHIMNQKLNKELSPEPQPNSEQKADNIFVSPSIANAVLGEGG